MTSRGLTKEQEKAVKSIQKHIDGGNLKKAYTEIERLLRRHQSLQIAVLLKAMTMYQLGFVHESRTFVRELLKAEEFVNLTAEHLREFLNKANDFLPLLELFLSKH